jgi:hypothetical protein
MLCHVYYLIMTYIDEWSKDKPRFLAMAAIELAFDADECFQCAEQIKREEGFIYKLPVPPLNEWLSLYKNHRRIFSLFKTTFIDSRGLAELTKDFSDNLFKNAKEIKRTGMEQFKDEYNKLDDDEKAELTRIFQEELKEKTEQIDRLHELQLEDIHADINDEIDVKLNARIKQDINKPEIRFLLQVFLPCFLLYKDYPSRLLREARKGDIEYIEKLIRLDRSIEFDKKISEFIHGARKNKIIDERLRSAIANGINEKVTRKKMKMNIAGLISFISIGMGRQLKESEIRDLFDAIAKDKGQSDVDTDIPDSQETFAKAIQRERRNWGNAFNNKSFN